MPKLGPKKVPGTNSYLVQWSLAPFSGSGIAR